MILYIIITILAIVVLFLSIALYYLIRKMIFLSEKDKDFLKFVIQVYCDYADDLGIQSKEQHKILSEELNKIKNKYLN